MITFHCFVECNHYHCFTSLAFKHHNNLHLDFVYYLHKLHLYAADYYNIHTNTVASVYNNINSHNNNTDLISLLEI